MVSRPDVARQKSDSLQLAVRLPMAWVPRLDALIPRLARPGVATTRTDAIRACIAAGLDALEKRK